MTSKRRGEDDEQDVGKKQKLQFLTVKKDVEASVEALRNFAALKASMVESDFQEAMEAQEILLSLQKKSISEHPSATKPLLASSLLASSNAYQCLQTAQEDEAEATTLALVLGQIYSAKLCRQSGHTAKASSILESASLLAIEEMKDQSINVYIDELRSRWNPLL